MGRRFSLHAIVIAALAACLVAAWPALAAKKLTRDRATLRPSQQGLDRQDRAPHQRAVCGA